MDCGFIYFHHYFDRPYRVLGCVVVVIDTSFILILFPQTILVLLIQLWVQLVSLNKPDDEIKINLVSFAGGYG